MFTSWLCLAAVSEHMSEQDEAEKQEAEGEPAEKGEGEVSSQL